MSNFLEHGGILQHRNLNMVASPKKLFIFWSCFHLLPYPLAPQLLHMEVEPWPNNLEKKLDDGGNMMGTYWEL
jgi:hypothetical protein